LCGQHVAAASGTGREESQHRSADQGWRTAEPCVSPAQSQLIHKPAAKLSEQYPQIPIHMSKTLDTTAEREIEVLETIHTAGEQNRQ